MFFIFTKVFGAEDLSFLMIFAAKRLNSLLLGPVARRRNFREKGKLKTLEDGRAGDGFPDFR